jgi:FAD/FMN-containing dehydrogenase
MDFPLRPYSLQVTRFRKEDRDGRVQGYNLDEFINPNREFDLTKLMVGSEGTLGVVVEAKLRLVPLPRAKSVLAIQFAALLEPLEATPVILGHKPSAVEVMDQFILNHTRQSPTLQKREMASALVANLFPDFLVSR